MHEMGWPSEHLPTSGPRSSRRLNPGQSAELHSTPAAAVPLDLLWALGMDSEIPVGFVRADYSQQRNDSHFIGLSRNLLAAGASWSEALSPEQRGCCRGLVLGRESAASGARGQGTPEGLRVLFLLLSWAVGAPSPGMTGGSFLYQFSLVVSPSSARPPLTAKEGRTPA